MGVIYKVNEDIKYFVISEKRLNPSLSCRALVDYVHQKFDVTLSKSSINNLLKNSHLSSPVGRRPSGESFGRKKFRLPEKRKIQILPKRDKDSPIYSSPSRLDINQKREKESSETTSSNLIRKGISTPALSRKISEIDGLGSFLLRAAQWELFGGPFLGAFLREFTKGTSSMDLDAIGDLLLYLKPFGINDISELDKYNQQGLWFLLNLNQKIDSATLFNVLNGIQDIRSMAIKLLIEIKQRMQLVKAIKLVLEDMSEIYLDPRLYSVWDENVQSELFLSLNCAMNTTTKKIVENVQSVNLHSPYSLWASRNQQANILPDVFIWFVQAFEGVKEKIIRKIIILDINGQEIVNFDAIPLKKRYWMCGIWPGQDLFNDLKGLKATKCHKINQKYTQLFNLLNLSPELSETQIRFRANLPDLAVVIAKDKNHEPPVCFILTNAGKDFNPYDLAINFFSEWHQNSLGSCDGYQRDANIDFNAFLERKTDTRFASSLIANTCDKEKIFEWILEIIHEYTKIRYLKNNYENYDNLTYLIQTLYSRAGNCEIFDNLILISLKSDSKDIRQYLSPYSSPIQVFNKNVKFT